MNNVPFYSHQMHNLNSLLYITFIFIIVVNCLCCSNQKCFWIITAEDTRKYILLTFLHVDFPKTKPCVQTDHLIVRDGE